MSARMCCRQRLNSTLKYSRSRRRLSSPTREEASVLRLFHAGIFAAALQAAVVTSLTAAVWLFWQQGWSPREPSTSSAALLAVAAPFLRPGYTLTSIAVTFTDSRFLDATADHVRRTFHTLPATKPNSAVVALFSQLCLVSFGFMILALEEPPALLFAVGRYTGYPLLAVAAWPALWSIGIASFGATARAINKSLNWPKRDL